MKCDKCGSEEKTYFYDGLSLCKECLDLHQGVKKETYDAPIELMFEEDAYTKEERETY
jgi:hypothetical protein